MLCTDANYYFFVGGAATGDCLPDRDGVCRPIFLGYWTELILSYGDVWVGSGLGGFRLRIFSCRFSLCCIT